MNCPRCEQDIDLGHSGCRDPQCPMDQVEQTATRRREPSNIEDVLAFELWWAKTGHEIVPDDHRMLARTIFIAGWHAGNDYAFEGIADLPA